MADPNPLVNGQGIERLRAAGVEVVAGVLEHEARELNEAFITTKTQRRPFGILKLAMTLDGKIATRSGESQWITGLEARRAVQDLRHSVDAIITGSGTFLKDRPRLTDRTGLPRRRELLRIVLDRRGRISPEPGWLVFGGSLSALVDELNRREIQSFLVEAGPDLSFNVAQAGIMDKVVAFIAPKLLGGSAVLAFGGEGFERLSDLIVLKNTSLTTAGQDYVLTAYFRQHPGDGPST
jgi:diaminohydroxyphosphoribosylaminopyrimidine deaminase/5-amino-6-(5-phosphoribosylamino)uracil reductase